MPHHRSETHFPPRRVQVLEPASLAKVMPFQPLPALAPTSDNGPRNFIAFQPFRRVQ